ncbi:zinc transporter ZIP1-like isoform X2 [Penaeus japonicus]|uniref:zinc transporter ZIP1-like isoform X2 n=1 Tax=Penaeus japonicus TaxID=27405 RepID=UPI001C70F3C6|nr:zinc transporter ZIP1-like isoform X2 [Penaeus japonicus]
MDSNSEYKSSLAPKLHLRRLRSFVQSRRKEGRPCRACAVRLSLPGELSQRNPYTPTPKEHVINPSILYQHRKRERKRERKMEVTHLQFLFMGSIFLVTTAVGLAPAVLKGTLSKRLKDHAVLTQRLLSCASCFGAGVFLFVCFMGLLPAADKKFHHFLEELGHTHEWETFAEFPWGFFVVICGFLVIFTIDKLVHAMEHAKQTAGGTSSHILLQKPSSETFSSRSQDLENTDSTDDCHNCHEMEGGHDVPSSVIFLVALGMHSVFEGIAVGLQTEKDKVLEFSVAVLVHETVMAFTFGMEVSKSQALSRWTKAFYVLIFTSTIPVGIAMGVGLQNAPSENREIVSAVLEAFATGIFIHVIFVEILAKEFPNHHHVHHHQQEKSVDDDSLVVPTSPSETCLMLEKIASICCGMMTLILLNVFMHGHHH